MLAECQQYLAVDADSDELERFPIDPKSPLQAAMEEAREPAQRRGVRFELEEPSFVSSVFASSSKLKDLFGAFSALNEPIAANFPAGVPGRGSYLGRTRTGEPVGVINASAASRFAFPQLIEVLSVMNATVVPDATLVLDIPRRGAGVTSLATDPVVAAALRRVLAALLAAVPERDGGSSTAAAVHSGPVRGAAE